MQVDERKRVRHKKQKFVPNPGYSMWSNSHAIFSSSVKIQNPKLKHRNTSR